MISVSEAQNKILETVKCSKAVSLEISEATGYVLAKNISSPLDLPPFNQSAMDGYALIAEDFAQGKSILVTGESAAGKSFSKSVSPGQAVRIFTGAEIPKNADAVVMQEKAVRQHDSLLIQEEHILPGQNIRMKGSQIRKGMPALSKGLLLSPAGIGFLASMGLKKISVYRKPAVSVIVTGNELQEAGTILEKGKIYESNALTLQSALRHYGIENVKTFFAGDDEKQTRKKFRKALKKSDIILFTGGISVGDYDYVGKALEKEKVKEIFYKVKQKPGKPLYFGTKNKKYIFGLPGNPASVLTCLYEYVLPAIRKFSGYTDCLPQNVQLSLSKDFRKKKGMTCFLKAVTDFMTVTPLEGQESYIMRTFAEANCLAVIPEESENVSAGDTIAVHLF